MTVEAELMRQAGRIGGPEGEALAARVDVNVESLALIARALMDVVIRRLLPMPGRYAGPGSRELALAQLDAIVDQASLERAVSKMRASPGGLAMGSATMALHHAGRIGRAATLDEAALAFRDLFYPSGPFDMAVNRIRRRGDLDDAVRDALAEALVAVLRGLALRS